MDLRPVEMEGMRRQKRGAVANQQEERHRRRVEALIETARSERSLAALLRVMREAVRQAEESGVFEGH